MIDAKKVAMMTRGALYEQGEGKEDRKIHRYSKSVYLGIRRVCRFVAVTISYILAAGLFCFRYVDDIFARGFGYDYKPLFVELGVGYIIVLAAGLLALEYAGRKRYDRMIGNLKEYDHALHSLEQYLGSEESEQ